MTKEQEIKEAWQKLYGLDAACISAEAVLTAIQTRQRQALEELADLMNQPAGNQIVWLIDYARNPETGVAHMLYERTSYHMEKWVDGQLFRTKEECEKAIAEDDKD
jgi:hypothetical protein